MLLLLPLFSGFAAAEGTRYIVMFRPGAGEAVKRSSLRSAGGTVLKELRFINSAVVTFAGEKSAAARAALSGEPAVTGVYEDADAFRLERAPAALEEAYKTARSAAGGKAWDDGDIPWPDPPSPLQFIPWGIQKTGAPAAWAVTRGEGVKVCVVDSGVDPSHKDLKDNIIEGINTTEEGPPQDFTDRFGHGSHIAGTVAAVDNAEGVIGVAPKAAIYAARVIRRTGTGRFSDVLDGLAWCMEKKTPLISLSLSVPYDYPPLKEAMEAVENAGILVVAAAGNSGGTVEFPAAYPQVIAVGAMDENGKAADFSARGPEVDFIAPGVAIVSAYMNGLYSESSGTSMATPHVTGLAALAIAAGGLKNAEEVRQALRKAASPLPLVPQEAQGAGFIDALKVVKDPSGGAQAKAGRFF